ncbi:sugar phosphate nucleotidyltransferase [Patescibacteria group bacterium]
MIKTIVIPAAGRGTRMKNLVKNKPKSLINVAGKPFLYYLLKRIKQAGFERVLIIVGHNKEVFTDFLQAEGREFPIELVDQNKLVPSGEYGTAVPIWALEKTIPGEAFVNANGDNLFGVRDLQKAAASDSTTIFGVRKDHPERYGVLEADDSGQLIRIHEKSPNPVTDIINSGLYTFQPEIFTAAREVNLSPRGEYEVTDALSLLAKDRNVKLEVCQDEWLDLGRFPDIPLVAKHLKAKKEIIS